MFSLMNRTLIKEALVCFFVFLFVPFLTTVAVSDVYAEEDLSYETVSKLRIIGNSRIPTSSISYYIELKEFEPFDKKILREDIKRLYKLDHFENINVEVNKLSDGVEVVFNIREKPSISSVKIAGNKHIHVQDVAKRVTIKRGMVFKPSLMHRNATRIEK